MYQRKISDLSFKTKKEAEKFMNDNPKLEYYEGTKTLEQAWASASWCSYSYSQGEYARPEYVLRRYKDGWGIKIIYYYFASTLFAPKDRRCVKLDFDVIA